MARKARADSAYARALARLARRDHSESELARLLIRAGDSEAEVGAALARLRREGYLDDRRFAGGYARSRLLTRGLGSNRIRADLGRRGVARGTVEAGLAEALADVSETDALDRLARRRWLQRPHGEPRRRLAGLWAFLLGRGFAPALVRERLAALLPRWRELLVELPEPLEPPEETHATIED